MPFFRVLVSLLLLAGILCFAMYAGTRQLAWRRRGLVIIKWTVLAALGFFAVLIAQALIEML